MTNAICLWCSLACTPDTTVECGGCETALHQPCAHYEVVIRGNNPYVYYFCGACKDS